MPHVKVVVMPAPPIKIKRQVYRGVRILVPTTGLKSWHEAMDAIRCLESRDNRMPKHVDYRIEDSGRALVVHFKNSSDCMRHPEVRLVQHFESIKDGLTLARKGRFDNAFRGGERQRALAG
jgi:hypothetical protein